MIGFSEQKSHGLFNTFLQVSQMKFLNYLISENRVFLLSGGNQIYVTDTMADNPFTEKLNKLRITIDRLHPEKSTIENLDDRVHYSKGLWSLLSSSRDTEPTQLLQNDQFRIGRQIINVAKIFTESQITEHNNSDLTTKVGQMITFNEQNGGKLFQSRSLQNSLKASQLRSSGISTCRICLEPNTFSNPFAPSDLCQCKQMPVHIMCMIEWLTSKSSSSTFKNMIYYDVSKLECEVCKSQIKPMIRFRNKDIFMVHIKLKLTKNLTVLELYELARPVIKGFLIIDFADKVNNQISFGVNEECDLIFKDPAISPFHANLIWKNEKLYIKDRSSQYGTYIKINGPITAKECKDRKLVSDHFLLSVHPAWGQNKCKCKAFDKQSLSINPVSHDQRIKQEIDHSKAVISLKDLSQASEAQPPKTEPGSERNLSKPVKKITEPIETFKTSNLLQSGFTKIADMKKVPNPVSEEVEENWELLEAKVGELLSCQPNTRNPTPSDPQRINEPRQYNPNIPLLSSIRTVDFMENTAKEHMNDSFDQYRGETPRAIQNFTKKVPSESTKDELPKQNNLTVSKVSLESRELFNSLQSSNIVFGSSQNYRFS